VPAEVLDRILDLGEVVTIGAVIDVLATWEPGRATSLGEAALPGMPERIVIRQPVPGGGWYEDAFAPGERL
jgi:hypothetical protein